MKRTFFTLVIVLFVPLFSLGVFHYAAKQYSDLIRADLLRSVDSATDLKEEQRVAWRRLFETVDFNQACTGQTDQDRQVLYAVPSLEKTCKEFTYWRWGTIAAYAYLILIAAYLGFLLICVQGAKKSRQSLIHLYRLGWFLSLIVAVVAIVVIGVLGVKSFFDFTVMISNRYFPKLLIIFGIGALIAIYQVVKAVFKRIPLEFNQEDAHSVTKEEAPLLWERVRNIAHRVGTEPPTEILIGTELNFYVTELSVNHLGGKSSGRILYLSSRLMKIMSEEEVQGVIGHELGHFKGEDTALTLKFYPFRFKTSLTLNALLTQIAALPAGMLVRTFVEWFEPVIATFSREREYAADQVGVSVSNKAAIAHSLVKMQIQSEAFMNAYETALRTGQKELPDEKAMFQSEVANDNTWKVIGTAHLPHPIDSHPPTADRLKILGYTLEQIRHEMKPVEQSAFDTWFGQESKAVKAVEERHKQLVTEAVQYDTSRRPDPTTEEGRALIDKFWPKKDWAVHSGKAFFFNIFGATLLGAIAAFVVIALLASVTKEMPGQAALLITLGVIFTGLVGWYAIRSFIIAKNSALAIDYEGISCQEWNRKILYREISTLNAVVNNSVCTMTITLKEKAAHPAKRRLRKNPVQKINVVLSMYRGGYNDIYGMIYHYWSNLAAF